MDKFEIKQAEFITSVGFGGDYPPVTKAEIAMVGKSNVGKSSLINSICNNSKLARVSQSPGKTRLINFYCINKNQFYLVDLPGYGFARAPKSEVIKWQELIESYLASGRLTHIFLLLDIRHDPTDEDRQMYGWVVYHGIPFTLIATKADKLAKSKRPVAAAAVAKKLGAPPPALIYSSDSGQGKLELLDRIGQILKDV